MRMLEVKALQHGTHQSKIMALLFLHALPYRVLRPQCQHTSELLCVLRNTRVRPHVLTSTVIRGSTSLGVRCLLLQHPSLQRYSAFQCALADMTEVHIRSRANQNCLDHSFQKVVVFVLIDSRLCCSSGSPMQCSGATIVRFG